MDCTPGFYSSGGATICSSCTAGRFSVTRASSCEGCAPGTFTPTTASSSCTKCPAGRHGAVENATDCTDCDVGTFQRASGQATCRECSPGSVSANPGSSSCKCLLLISFCPCHPRKNDPSLWIFFFSQARTAQATRIRWQDHLSATSASRDSIILSVTSALHAQQGHSAKRMALPLPKILTSQRVSGEEIARPSLCTSVRWRVLASAAEGGCPASVGFKTALRTTAPRATWDRSALRAMPRTSSSQPKRPAVYVRQVQ
jgi:hypothetical protein